MVRSSSDSHRLPVTMVVGSWLASGWLFAGASVADCACKPAELAANASIVGMYFIWISISVCLRSGLWRRKVGSCNKVRSLPFPTPVSTGSGSKGSFLCSCKETSQTQTRSPLRKVVRKEGGLLPCQPRIRTEYGCVVNSFRCSPMRVWSRLPA